MTEKRRVKIFFCGACGEVNADVYVSPEVRVTQREGVAKISIGGHALEINLPCELYDQMVRGQ